jgi:hypothetical protein
MNRTLIGGLIVVAVGLSACSTKHGYAVDNTIDSNHTFRTSGYVPQPVKTGPYTDEDPMLDLNDPIRKVDSTGMVDFYYWTPQHTPAPHPQVRAFYAISALDAYHRTGNKTYLDRALVNAHALIDDSVNRDGAMWFPYTFEWSYFDVTLHTPWWSAMAQGQALSLFTELDRLQPDAGWRALADKTFRSFEQRSAPGQPWAVFVDNGDLWLEEYAGDAPPLQVLNGHIFAIYGLYDYYMLTGNEQARQMFDGAATTVLQVMPRIRHQGGISYYCARVNYCRVKGWELDNYHMTHIKQLNMLAEMTGDQRFHDWAELLRSDFVLPA